MDFENYHHTQQLTFFLLTESGSRHRRGHPPAFLMLSYSDKGRSPTVHALPLPIKLQSFTTSRPERNGCVGGKSDGRVHSVETFSFPFLLEALINSEIFTYSNQCSDLSNRFLSQQKNEAIPFWLTCFTSSSLSMWNPDSWLPLLPASALDWAPGPPGSTGCSAQGPAVTCLGEDPERWVCVQLNQFPVPLKLTQNWKATTPQ